MNFTGANLMEADPARATEALLSLRAGFWAGSTRPLAGHLEAPAPEELVEFEGENAADWFKGIYPSDFEGVKAGALAMARGAECQPLEYRMVTEKRGIVWVRHSFTYPRALSGRNSGETLAGFVQVLDERKRLEAECLRVCEREKAAIGQELHDDVCQLLAGVACMLEAIGQKAKTAMPELVSTFQELGAQLNAGMDRTRSLAHSLVPLRLVNMGLGGALRELASHAERNFNIKVHVRCPRSLPPQKPEQILHLYRIAQEAISNSYRHGKATEIKLELLRQRKKMILTIHDNGSGLPAESTRKEGIGLHIMRYRAGAIGAQVTVTSEPKQGTLVTVRCEGASSAQRGDRDTP